MICPVCHHPLEGRYCGNCGARVSADGMWAYRGGRSAGAPPPQGTQPAGQPQLQHPTPGPTPQAGQYHSQPAPGSPQQGQQYPYPSAQPATFQAGYAATAPAPTAPRRRAGKRTAVAAAILAAVIAIAIWAFTLLVNQNAEPTTTLTPSPVPTNVPAIHTNFGPRVAVPGSVLSQLRFVHDLGPLPGSAPLEAEVALRVRDPQGLEQAIKGLYDTQSSSYHHFLSPEEFASRYAPSRTDRANVAGWLAAQGLNVTDQPRNGLLIEVHGTARQMSRAFGTSVDRYADASGFTFHANSTVVHVPQQLQRVVLDVDGLSNIGHVGGSIHPRSVPRDSSGGFTPQDLRTAYNMTSLYDAGMDGRNQTIALAEWGDFDQHDIDQYDQRYGISAPRPERVSVPFNGQKARPGAGQEEVELDIEVLHAIAPKAHVLVYVSPQTNGAGLAQANRLVSDDRANLVSVSWGFPDVVPETALLSAVDQVLAESAAQGQAILVASGDAGAFDEQSQPDTPVVDYPSSDPWVTAVGGTSLYVNSSGYERESVWGNSSDKSGSGGGLSRYFKRPWYQFGPGVINQYSARGTRQTPDVAAVADPNTGYSVYVTLKGRSGWAEFGGTSAATPLWAGYMALVQQKLGHKLGFLNPLLYAMGQRSRELPAPPYHDVTEGNNLYYPATPGWDFGTGWGSMDGTNMLQDIQQLETK